MTVAELIAELQKMPQDAECVIPADGALSMSVGPIVVRAIPDGERFGIPAYEMIQSDAHARRHLAQVRPVVVIG